MDISFNVYGTQQLSYKILGLIDNIEDFRPLWKEYQKDFYLINRQQFATEGARGSQGAWKELTPKYAAWKEKNYPERSTLVLTGQLYDSLVNAQNSDAIAEVDDPKEMRLGTQNKLAIIHYFGSDKNNLPPRRPIDLAPRDKMRWAKDMHAYIIRMIKEKFGGGGAY